MEKSKAEETPWEKKKKEKNRLKEGRKGTPNEGLNVITVLNVIKS